MCRPGFDGCSERLRKVLAISIDGENRRQYTLKWPGADSREHVTNHADLANAGANTVMESIDRTEHSIVVRGESPESLIAEVVQSLLVVLRGAGKGGEDEGGSIVPFQASGATIEAMLRSLVNDILESVGASPSRLVDAELSHVMKTDEGLRSWGYLRFGTETAVDRDSWSADGVSVTTPLDGELEFRILLLGDPMEPTPASVSDRR